ncbi:deoxynucleoside kinase-like [Agrilus planipennis]|uniref:Deoxynucleoside kinase-like n=1 Tax=Agrilus planipennis TaxID=224129 RepID=A0A7F5RKH1_AGRPL|nr:deoxynucleoside kinase-like [Agrilus planipennis]
MARKLASTSLTFVLETCKRLGMEGYVVTVSGKKRSVVTPTKCSPTKKANFMQISPLLMKITTPSNRPFRVSVEGNIGAGKSTFIKYFSKFPGIETYQEPIEWWRNCNGHNLLELLYSDTKKWYFTFQSYVQLTRIQTQLSKPKDSLTRTQMFERSVQNNRYCFLEQAYQNGIIHPADYAISDKWYKQVMATFDLTLDLIVYLRSSPEIVFERMRKRGRPEETAVPLQYLKELHEAHEKWLMSDDVTINNVPVLILDADSTLEEIHEMYHKNEDKILGYDIKGRPVEKKEKDKVRRVLKLD